MYETDPTHPTAATRLRLAQGLSIAGMLGLCVTAFLPHLDVGGVYAPVGIFEHVRDAIESGIWVLILPFLLAPVMLLVRIASLVVRRKGFDAVAGWTLCLLVFGLFMFADIAIWKQMGRAQVLSRWRSAENLVPLSWVLVMSLTTLAILALCGLRNARMRLAACSAAVGTYDLYFLACVLAANLMDRSPDILFGFYVSLGFSFLMTVGGIWETKLLWHRDAVGRDGAT